MSIIKPFRALRPRAESAEDVSSVPYDVLNTAEARELAAGSTHSFLHVSRSEIDLADDVNPYSDEVYATAKANFDKLQRDGVLELEDEPALYVYRLQMGEQIQTSVVACCSVDEYDNDLIKKHEKTRPDKENDRTRHMIELEAQTGLIFLCYRGLDEINSLVAKAVETTPIYDFSAPDVNGNSIRNTIWKISESAPLVEAFAKVPAIYIADGHHRAASSSRARAALRDRNPNHDGTEEYNFVIAALFPAEELKILPYNRVVKDLNGMRVEEFFDKLPANGFNVEDTTEKSPADPGIICAYAGGKWRKLTFNIAYLVDPGVIATLDVNRLEQHVLGPLLGIEDVRTDKRIDFVGGIRGTAELERLVDSGKFAIAFSMYATTVDQLLAVSDLDAVMPPKSTWFEPKLRDGLLIHLI